MKIFFILVTISFCSRIDQASAILDSENGILAAPSLPAVEASIKTFSNLLINFRSYLILELLSFLTPKDMHKVTRSCRLIHDESYFIIHAYIKLHITQY